MRPPAFQFYPDDFIAGTADMTNEEVGAYIRLLCHQWSKGGIPNDPERISRMAGAMPVPSLGYVTSKFRLCPDGCLRNDRLEAERVKQEEFRRIQSEKGKSGAEKRWKNGPGHAPAMPALIPNDSSPSPLPSPITIHGASRPSVLAYGVEIPESHQQPETIQALHQWWKYKAEMGQAYKKTGTEITLGKLVADFPNPQDLTNAIKHSIANNWKAVFKPTQGNPPKTTEKPPGWEPWHDSL